MTTAVASSSSSGPSSSPSSSLPSSSPLSPSSVFIDVEPEVHLIGELIGGHFPSVSNAFCAFHVEYGTEWICVGGDESGQTHVDHPDGDCHSAHNECVWGHPIDLHFYTKSLVGWPQIVLQCGTLDSVAAKQLLGYGFAYFPSQIGRHTLEVDIWRPQGTLREELVSFMMGGAPTLLHTDLIANVMKAKEERPHLYTKSIGKVYIEVEVMLRNFKLHRILTGDKNYEDDKKEQQEKAKGG